MPDSISEQPAPVTPRRRSRVRAVLLTLIVIALLAGTAYYLAQRARTPQAAGAARGPGGFSAVTVGTAVAQQGELPILIDALGTVTPPATATLVPQVSGILTEVLFTEGQTVKKGQVLARIDVRPFQQALDQARGTRLRDQAQLAAARVTLQRYQTLWEQDSVARQTLDTQAALVKQLEGTVDADAASERSAQLNVDFTTMRAPISGRIGLRNVDPGNLVSTGTTGGIATITQITPIDVVFSVPQGQVQAVLAAERTGKLPVVALDRARTQTLATGTFLTLNNEVNTATGTVLAKARFANADGRLFPNEFVNARLQLGSQSGLLVPVTAVRTGPNGDYVYVVDADGVAHMRAVTSGLATPDQTLITKGLQAGERVVTEGGDQVKDGGKVKLAEAAKAPAAAETPAPAGQAAKPAQGRAARRAAASQPK
jgi:multidrug efflux system membrane fusion protein